MIEVALLNIGTTVWLTLSLHNLENYSVSCGVPSLGRLVSITGIIIFFFTAPAILQLKTVREFIQLTFILLGWVLKFYCMVYEKYII